MRGFVVVSGPPASGKSTLAAQLGPALGLPVLAKDDVKAALLEVLPAPDIAASRRVGTAATAALLAVAAKMPGAVLEAVWYPSRSLPALRALPGPVVELFCRIDPAVAAERYAARTGSRPHGFYDAGRSAAELRDDEVSNPVAGGWPVLEVDTSGEPDLDALLAAVRPHLHP